MDSIQLKDSLFIGRWGDSIVQAQAVRGDGSAFANAEGSGLFDAATPGSELPNVDAGGVVRQGHWPLTRDVFEDILKISKPREC